MPHSTLHDRSEGSTGEDVSHIVSEIPDRETAIQNYNERLKNYVDDLIGTYGTPSICAQEDTACSKLWAESSGKIASALGAFPSSIDQHKSTDNGCRNCQIFVLELDGIVAALTNAESRRRDETRAQPPIWNGQVLGSELETLQQMSHGPEMGANDIFEGINSFTSGDEENIASLQSLWDQYGDLPRAHEWASKRSMLTQLACTLQAKKVADGGSLNPDIIQNQVRLVALRDLLTLEYHDPHHPASDSEDD